MKWMNARMNVFLVEPIRHLKLGSLRDVQSDNTYWIIPWCKSNFRNCPRLKHSILCCSLSSYIYSLCFSSSAVCWHCSMPSISIHWGIFSMMYGICSVLGSCMPKLKVREESKWDLWEEAHCVVPEATCSKKKERKKEKNRIEMRTHCQLDTGANWNNQ